jgi:hypothetical protein
MKTTRSRRRGAFGLVMGILQDPQAVVMTWVLKLLLAGSFVAIVAIEGRAFLDRAGGLATPRPAAAAREAGSRIAEAVVRVRADVRPVHRLASGERNGGRRSTR